jgi:hypothetical protein
MITTIQQRECNLNCVKYTLGLSPFPGHGREKGKVFLKKRRHPPLKHNT